MTFEDIYKTYYTKVFRYILKHTDTKEDAEDITSRVFMSCYQNFSSYDPEKSSESTWLFVISKNALKNYYRDKKSDIHIDDPDFPEPTAEEDFNKAVEYVEIRKILAKALEELEIDNRKIVVLKYFRNKSHREIAELLGLSEVNVRVKLNRSLKKIRTYFEKNNIEWEF